MKIGIDYESILLKKNQDLDERVSSLHNVKLLQTPAKTATSLSGPRSI